MRMSSGRTCLYVARDETRKTGPTKWRSTDRSLGSLLWLLLPVCSFFYHLTSAGLSHSLARASTAFLPLRAHACTHVGTCAYSTCRRVAAMSTYAYTYVHTCATDGQRGNLDARDVANDVCHFSRWPPRAFPSASLPRIIARFLETRYCRWLSGIMKRPLTLFLMSRDFI